MDKPQIEPQQGPAPTELVAEDIVVGDGAEAQPGGLVEVHYVGVDYETTRSLILLGTVASPSSFHSLGLSLVGRKVFQA